MWNIKYLFHPITTPLVNGTDLTKGRIYELRHKDQIAVLDPSFHLFDFVDEKSYLRTSTFPVEVIAKYLVGCVVGAGTFSTVRRGWTRDTGKPIALKIIKKLPSSLLDGSYSEDIITYLFCVWGLKGVLLGKGWQD